MSLDIPDDYEAESYRAGYAAAMRDIGQQALSGALDVAPDTESPDDAADEECPDCGAALLSSMGAPETATPAGTVCPDCEL